MELFTVSHFHTKYQFLQKV